jgi:hypothetical protein
MGGEAALITKGRNIEKPIRKKHQKIKITPEIIHNDRKNFFYTYRYKLRLVRGIGVVGERGISLKLIFYFVYKN